ncbi:MAG TPA: phosphonate ABC transporter, permease protein PhnE [Aggregatilineales bacterium]|nr:phosphonate ABC transporter, permease protein PhnE [Aggregatilineales bacterium]
MTDATDVKDVPGRTARAAVVAGESLRTRLLSPFPRVGLRRIALVVVIGLILFWGVIGVLPDITQMTRGVPPLQAAFNFVARLVPASYEYTTPDDFSLVLGAGSLPPLVRDAVTSVQKVLAAVFPYRNAANPTDVIVPVDGVISYPKVFYFIMQTVQMALIGTLVGVFLSVPFGLLAARNTSPHPSIYQGTRLILNVIRAFPELIVALVFVAMVGLGPFTGMLALAVAGIGSKGKLYAEAIEAIDPQQVLAVRATGAGRLQAFIYGVIPQALPLILSYSLLSFESNVRTATILGYVGAGGIGLLIYQYIQLFQFDKLMGTIIVIVVTVTAIDRLSDFLRRKFI